MRTAGVLILFLLSIACRSSNELAANSPLDTCPECKMKIAWAMNYSPSERYKNLAEFSRRQGRVDEQNRMLGKARAVTAVGE